MIGLLFLSWQVSSSQSDAMQAGGTFASAVHFEFCGALSGAGICAAATPPLRRDGNNSGKTLSG